MSRVPAARQAVAARNDPVRKRQEPPTGRLFDPRNGVLLVLAAVVGLGGGQRLWHWWRGRRAVRRLEDPDVTAVEVLAAAGFGRAGLIEFFRLLSEGQRPEIRRAAGEALAVLWKGDDLIAEEEKAVVVRGFDVRWTARRRYPRALDRPIPIAVAYGLPFLGDGEDEASSLGLEWSHRVTGTQRASLETFSPWTAGPGRVEFTLEPGDFSGNGPHRLILQTRARISRPAATWELELPHVPFTFEFDPILRVDSLLALADSSRGEAVAQALHWIAPAGETPGMFLPLNDAFVGREPPAIGFGAALPCDLAHRLDLEFEGIDGRFPAGAAVVEAAGAAGKRLPIDGPEWSAAVPIETPGDYRLRAVLTPDPALGWAAPGVRSIWPETIVSDWATLRVIRR